MPKPFPSLPLPLWGTWLPMAAYTVNPCIWHPFIAADLSSCLFLFFTFSAPKAKLQLCAEVITSGSGERRF